VKIEKRNNSSSKEKTPKVELKIKKVNPSLRQAPENVFTNLNSFRNS